MRYLLYFLLYGVLATAAIGLLASWIDRKVTARVQYRVGPPLLQPVIDIVKLLGKELVIPAGVSRTAFLTAPVVGFASVAVVSTLLWMNNVMSWESSNISFNYRYRSFILSHFTHLNNLLF